MARNRQCNVATKPRIQTDKQVVNRAIRGYRVDMNSDQIAALNHAPSEFVRDALLAWQEKLDAMPPHITPAHKQQATEVLLKLMRLRAQKSQKNGQ